MVYNINIHVISKIHHLILCELLSYERILRCENDVIVPWENNDLCSFPVLTGLLNVFQDPSLLTAV